MEAAALRSARCRAAEIEWTRNTRNINWQIPYAASTPSASDTSTAQININEALKARLPGARTFSGSFCLFQFSSMQGSLQVKILGRYCRSGFAAGNETGTIFEPHPDKFTEAG